MTRLSVVLPVHSPNREFLELAIRSVYAQTTNDWQLIVVNDGNWEITRAVARDFDDKLTLIESDHFGASVARNKGILASSSEFVAFLDSDDVWLPDKLNRQLLHLEQNDHCAFSFTGVRSIDVSGNLLDEGTPSLGPDPFYSRNALQDLCKFNVCLSSVVVRRSSLYASGLFEPLHGYSEDLELLVKLCRFFSFAFDPLHQTYYRKHPSNASSRYKLAARLGDKVFSRIIRVAKEFNEPDLLEASIMLRKRVIETTAYAAIDAARFEFNSGDPLGACEHLKFALCHSPGSFLTSVKTWAKKRFQVRRAWSG